MFLLQSNEMYGLMSKDLTEVSSQATTSIGSAASTVKKTLVVSGFTFYGINFILLRRACGNFGMNVVL